MEQIEVTLKVPAPPAGYEVQPEVRPVTADEYYWYANSWQMAGVTTKSSYLVATKIQSPADELVRCPACGGEGCWQDQYSDGSYARSSTECARCNGTGEVEPSDLPNGWTREGKYVLAPVEWRSAGPHVSRGITNVVSYAYIGASVYTPDPIDTNYRVVGFLDRSFHRSSMSAKPYPRLLDWKATHAVLEVE